MDHDERSLGSDLRSAKDLELAGRLEEAAEIYRRLASDNPQNWEVRQRFARLSWNRQQRDQAFAWLGEAIEISPDQPELHIERADYLFAMGRLDEAQASIKNALALAAGEADFHVKLALVQLERRDGDGAWATAQRAIELDPGHKGACQILGNLCWQRGELEAAVEWRLRFDAIRSRPGARDRAPRQTGDQRSELHRDHVACGVQLAGWPYRALQKPSPERRPAVRPQPTGPAHADLPSDPTGS
jgi:tetratricopeptide (TPR) repeat protein